VTSRSRASSAEVVFPETTVPPFFPSFVALRPAAHFPSKYARRRGGACRRTNRWMADWVRRATPSAAAPGSARCFLNDVDDAIEDVKWIKENGLRGGVLISAGSRRTSTG